MYALENEHIQKYQIDSTRLMECAGIAIYQKMCEFLEKSTRILIVCGHGNNGGDGFVLARLLFLQSYTIQLHFVGEYEKMGAVCKHNFEICKALEIPHGSLDEDYDVIVDAMFGIGLKKSLEGKYVQTVQRMNAMQAFVCSIDLPSGICANSGKVMQVAVQANITYALQYQKIGTTLNAGRQHANKVEVCDLFMSTTPKGVCIQTIEKEKMHAYFPKRIAHSHKNTYGKLLCIGGSQGMVGAICMAAKAALRSGCGGVCAALDDVVRPIFHMHVLEGTSIAKEDIPLYNQYTAYVIGCGMGRKDTNETLVDHVLCRYDTMVVDADALYYLDKQKHLQQSKTIVLTPHMKEFSDLIELPIEEVLQNPIEYVKQFCATYPNIVLVLKNDTTIIAQGDKMFLNQFGNNGLSVGGSGDVLAGIIAGLLCQGSGGLDAAVLGVFIHAYSADIIREQKSEFSLLPQDIIEKIGETILQIQRGYHD